MPVCQSMIASGNNPCLQDQALNYGLIRFMSFREYLSAKLKEAGMRPAELVRRAKTSPQNISRILTDKPHPISAAPPKVKRDTVERIAAALSLDVNEALEAAGHAPSEPPTKMEQLLKVLESNGIDTLQAFGGFERLRHLSDEEYDELIRTIMIGIRVWNEQYNTKQQ